MAILTAVLTCVAFGASLASGVVATSHVPLPSALDKPVPFNQTCHVGSYAFDGVNSTLGLYCNTDDWQDFAYDWTVLDLNLCIGNNGGDLIPYPDGNYSTSCQGCNVTWSHVYLAPTTTATFTSTPHAWTTTTVTSTNTPRWDDLFLGCACEGEGGYAVSATLDLNQAVFNENGTIGCYSYTGSAMPAKPTATTTTTTISSSTTPATESMVILTSVVTVTAF